MALVKCKECGNEISKKADICPHCGFKKPKTSAFTWIVLFVFILVMIGQLMPDMPKPPKNPETQEEKEDSARYAFAMIAGQALKKNLKDPESVDWIKILVNKDASVACYVYRARNSFNGMTIESTVVTKMGVISSSKSMLKKECANKELYDLTRAKGSI
jgi:hypothetical protein